MCLIVVGVPHHLEDVSAIGADGHDAQAMSAKPVLRTRIVQIVARYNGTLAPLAAVAKLWSPVQMATGTVGYHHHAAMLVRVRVPDQF